MGYCTVGKTIYPGYEVALWYNPDETFKLWEECSRFRIVLVEEGTGIVRLNGRRGTFIAPALICLNETDEAVLERCADLKARSFYFHPNVINSVFDFENIRRDDYSFSQTERHDLSWLRSFTIRNEKYSGQLNVGPATGKRLAGIFDLLGRELEAQRDDYWPCRSRSFFLELLFLIDRVYTSPGATEEIALPDTVGDVDPIILYLHTHYQDRITIAELTRLFHLNRTTLTERFYEATGLSIMSYLIGLRVRLASLMLRDTTLPVSEVMDRVGFKDMTHFGRMFRRYTGLTPSDYRQRYCWMLQSG